MSPPVSPPWPLAAAADVKRETAAKLVDVMMTERTYQAMIDELTQRVAPPIRKDVHDRLMRAVDYRTLRDHVIESNASIFSEEELAALLAFYGSPTGRSINQKMPQAMARTGQLLACELPSVLYESAKVKVAQQVPAEKRADTLGKVKASLRSELSTCPERYRTALEAL